MNMCLRQCSFAYASSQECRGDYEGERGHILLCQNLYTVRLDLKLAEEIR